MQLKDDEDTLWHEDQRETTQELLARGVAFVRYLMKRPETRMAVVTHSSFLYHLFASFGFQAGAPVKVRLSLRTTVMYSATSASACLGN